MADQLLTMTFAEWECHVFDHPVTDPRWYWDLDADTREPEPGRCVEFLNQLFKDPESALSGYSDAQLNQGFWFLLDNGASNTMFSLTNPNVPWPARRACIRSMVTLFERLFAVRCTGHLSHLDEQEASPLKCGLLHVVGYHAHLRLSQ